MNAFGTLLKKELRELLTPKVFLPKIVVILVFGAIGQVTSQEAERASKETGKLVVIDHDQTTMSAQVVESLRAVGFEVDLVASGLSIESFLAEARAKQADAAVSIPAEFAQAYERQESKPLDVYAIVRSLSLMAGQADSKLAAVTQSLSQSLSDQLIQERTGLSPEFVKNPITTTEHVMVGEKVAQVPLFELVAQVQSQTYFIPLILFIIISFGAQLVATAIASEKENKTLETLLAAPISRSAIVAAKLVAAGILALVFAVVYMFGFRSYMNGVSGGQAFEKNEQLAQALSDLGVTLTSVDYVLLGATLFIAILVALALALILGAFAEDVKGIQATITPLMILVFVPYLLINFIDLEKASTALKAVVYAIPFSHPFLASQQIMLGNTQGIWIGIIYQLVILVLLIWVASRIFATDAIVTMKLSFKKKRG